MTSGSVAATRSRSILPALALVASGLVEAASAQAVFEPPQVVPLPIPSGFVTNPVLGDLDQDGDLDAVISAGTSSLAWVRTFVNDGSGTLTPGPVKQGYGGPIAAAMHDMDGDTLPDYLLAAENGVFVLWGSGQGRFGDNTFFSSDTSRIAAGDVGGDAVPDIVLTTPGFPGLIPARLQVWTGNASGFALVHSQQIPAISSDLDLADVDGDGLLDALVSRLDGVATWHAGDPTVGFFGPHTLPASVPATRLATGDLDGDGDIDLVLGSALPQIQPLFNDGEGGFTPGVILPAGANGASPAIADIDSDGHADIVLDGSGSGGAGQLVIWRGLGGGAFEEDVHVTAEGLPSGDHLIVAGLDGDSRLDVLTMTGGLAVYLNRTYGAGSPFLDLGFALPGSQGYPVQIASGALTAGTPFAFRLLNGLPGAPATLVLGVSAAFIPHKGGVMVPSPDFLFPGFVIDGAGAFTLSGTWPNGVPSGATGYLQWWFKDAAGPTPAAASSGLRFTTP